MPSATISNSVSSDLDQYIELKKCSLVDNDGKFDQELRNELATLSELYDYPVVHRTNTNVPTEPSKVMAVLAVLTYGVSWMRTSGSFLDGEFFLAVHPNWIYKHTDRTNAKTRNILYLRRGISIEKTETPQVEPAPSFPLKGGYQFVVTTFQYPQAIAFFVNYQTLSSNNDHVSMLPTCKLAQTYEENLYAAQSGGIWLEHDVNDKFLTRCLLKSKGVCVPEFIALRNGRLGTKWKASDNDPITLSPSHAHKAQWLNRFAQEGSLIFLDDVLSKTDIIDSSSTKRRNMLVNIITRFLNRGIKSLVIKPCGSRFCSCQGVKIFHGLDKSNSEFQKIFDDAVDHLSELLLDSTDEECVLIDERISTPPVRWVHPGDKEKSNWDWVVRVISPSFTKDSDVPVCAGSIARVARWGRPVNASVGYFTKSDSAFRQANLFSVEDALKSLNALGPAFFSAWEEFESGKPRADLVSPFSKTILVGFDVMMKIVKEIDGKFIVVPCVIEVNDHESGGYDEFDLLNPKIKGSMARPILELFSNYRDKVSRKIKFNAPIIAASDLSHLELFDLTKAKGIPYETPYHFIQIE